LAGANPALQWGHAFSSVEVGRVGGLGGGGVAASMGPRFFKRGSTGHWPCLILRYILRFGRAGWRNVPKRIKRVE
jgi:hypothetical protein